MLRNLCSVATMYRTVLIKDLCNSKRKQEQVSTEMQKYAKTSHEDLPKDIAVLGDPRKRLLLVSYKIPEFSPFTLGGIQPTTSFFYTVKCFKFCVHVLRNSKTLSFQGYNFLWLFLQTDF